MKLIGLLAFLYFVFSVHEGSQRVALEIKAQQACIEKVTQREQVDDCFPSKP